MLFDSRYLKDLNSNELRTLMIMKVMAGGAENLEASRPEINEWISDISDKTLKRTIDSLTAKGYIAKKEHVGRTPTTYIFIK